MSAPSQWHGGASGPHSRSSWAATDCNPSQGGGPRLSEGLATKEPVAQASSRLASWNNRGMHLYSGSTQDFVADAVRSRIAQKLDDAFFAYFRHHPSPSEVRSWQNSLRAMADAVTLADLNDHGIVVELQLPLSSRRLDCLLTGHDDGDRPQAVIVELKQWDTVGLSSIEDCVTVFLGNRERDVLHPSRQVGNYERYMKDVHTTFSEGRLGLAACGYMHNMRDADSLLFDPAFRSLLAQYPLFTGGEVDEFATFLTGRLVGGDGVSLLEEVLKGRYRPHKRLLSHVSKMIANEPTYVLLDEQQVVINHILGRVRDRQGSTDKASSSSAVGRGPASRSSRSTWSGALAARASSLSTRRARRRSPRTSEDRRDPRERAVRLLQRLRGRRAKALDVLISTRRTASGRSSDNRFTQEGDRSDLPQVEELIKAAKTTVFFIDDCRSCGPARLGARADPGNNRATWHALCRARAGSTVPVRWLRGSCGGSRTRWTCDGRRTSCGTRARSSTSTSSTRRRSSRL